MREKLYTIAGHVVSTIIVIILITVIAGILENIGIIPRMQTEAPPPTEPAWFPAITA